MRFKLLRRRFIRMAASRSMLPTTARRWGGSGRKFRCKMRFKLLRHGTGGTSACSTRERASYFVNTCRYREASIEYSPKTAQRKHR